MADFAIALHVVVFLIASHSLFWSLVHNVSGLFKIVRMKIARLEEFVNKTHHHEELVEIVRLQETAYRSARSIEKALNVLMLVIYGMCAIEICVAMTALSLVRFCLFVQCFKSIIFNYRQAKIEFY